MQATRPNTCSIDDCTAPAHARGWCTKHYQRWKKHGDPTRSLVEERPSVCTINGCERPVHGLGLCAAHWTRQHRHGHPLGGGGDRQPAPSACVVDGCDRTPVGRGLCNPHWKADRLARDPEYREQKNAAWRAWATEHADEIAETQRRYREANAEQIAERMTLWRAENRDLLLLYTWTKRRRRYGLPENVIDIVDPDVVYERDGGTCRLCGDAVDRSIPWPDPLSATIDHTVPANDRSSEHSYANTALAHWDCNRRKHTSEAA